MAKNILRLDSSIKKTGFYSRDLSDNDENWSAANFTAADERTPEQDEYLASSDTLADKINNADLLVKK